MGWRDNLLPGSFRGAAFGVEASTSEQGRQVAVHEFPGASNPAAAVFVEDMGSAPSRFHVEAFVVGDDYFAQKRALIDALNEPGPGTLVHPYFGVMLAQPLKGFQIAERWDKGRMCAFTVEFIATSAVSEPQVVALPSTQVAVFSGPLIASSGVSFTKRIVTTGAPQFVVDAADDEWQSAWQIMNAGKLTGAAQPLADLAKVIDSLGGSAVHLIMQPVFFVEQIKLAFGLAYNAAASKVEAFKFYLAFFGLKYPGEFGSSKYQVAAFENGRTMAALVRSQAVANAAQAAAAMSFASSNDALIVRAELEDEIDALAEFASDADYAELVALRTRVVALIPPDIESLPRVDTFTPAATLPSLVLAQQLYADGSRADEIVSRNHIAHPGEIPAGVAVEVLVDD